MKPSITVVIPTYNRAVFLEKAIESVLMQDYDNFNVVISDNASSDNTAAVAELFSSDPRITYKKNNTNIGMVGNWRKAVYEYVSGDWFLILSDDDYFIDSGYLSKAARLISSDDELVLVYANGYIRYEPEGRQVPLRLPFDRIGDGATIFLSRGEIKPADFLLCNTLFNYKKAVSLQPFSNLKCVCCDSELFLKLCLRGKVGIISDYVSIYRVHGENLLLSVRSDFELFLNSLDFMINPYIDAIDGRYLGTDDLEYFRKRKVIPLLTQFFLISARDHSKRYQEAVDHVSKIGYSLLEDIFKRTNYNFRIRMFLVLHFPAIYRLIARFYSKS